MRARLGLTTPPSEADALPIRIESERGDDIVRPGESDLRAMVNRIGGDGDHFLILSPVPFRPRHFMQTYRMPDHFDLEYREEYRQYHADVTDADSVVRAMVAWARGGTDWKSGHEWRLEIEHERVEVEPLDAEAADYARRIAETAVAEGSSSFEDIVQAMTESAEPDNPVSAAQAEAMLEPLWLARVEEQKSWPETTDADDMEVVFDDLNAAGITARMNFACCQRCGVGEIRDEAAEGDHGYAFYHQQDADGLPDGSVYVAYGAYAKDEAKKLAVGREVVNAFENNGFITEWDGSATKRILVTDIDWRKRLE